MIDGALSSSQVAKLLPISDTKIRQLTDSGLLPHWKVPGSRHRRYRYEDVVRFAQVYGMPLTPRRDRNGSKFQDQEASRLVGNEPQHDR